VLTPVLLLFCAIYAVYTYIVPLLETAHSAGQVPLFLTIYGLGGLVGSQLGGKLVDSFGATRPLLLLLALFVVLQAVFPFSLASPYGTAIVMFLLTLCSWGCFAPIQTRALSAEPEHANIVFALINSSIFLGGAVGAALGGVLYSLVPVTALPFAAALLTAAAVMVILTDRARNDTAPANRA
jgi:MFS transporter, DHA1 family, inner membrane transport protein